jgi:6-phosphofructokinase
VAPSSVQRKLAIVACGGPAPGINGVIGAATIQASLAGVEVVGIQGGFQWLMVGDTSHVVPLTVADTSWMQRGGSCIGMSRANPTRNPEHLQNVADALARLGVEMLVTIGGDDTAYTAHKLAGVAGPAGGSGAGLRVVHVPKTIDNDLDLPPEVTTFGYQTARGVGAELVRNLMVDAETTARWYFVVAMGRKAGHLALGIGKAAGATLTVIPEEFHGRRIGLTTLADILAGAVIKRLAHGRSDGVAVLAEGLAEIVPAEDLASAGSAERDAHGNLRLDEVALGDVVKGRVRERLRGLGLTPTLVAKNIGYELRCADPIAFDLEYTRDLGDCAARYVIGGGTNALISIQRGRFEPIALASMMDAGTGRMRVRMVDVDGDPYRAARAGMVRLERSDLDDGGELARLAVSARLSPARLREELGHVVEVEAIAGT